jgi:hypothetical protein
MKFAPSSRVLTGAKSTLAALAILAGLGLATPSASASITLSYIAAADSLTNTTGSPATNSLSTGVLTVGNFSYSLTATTNDPAGGTTSFAGSSSLSNVSFAVHNTGTAADTIGIQLTGAGFTISPGAVLGDLANFVVSGSSASSTSADTTTAKSSITYGSTTTFIPTVNGTTSSTAIVTGVPTSGSGSQPYRFNGASPPLGNSNVLTFTNPSTFSITQALEITLGVGDSVTLTFNTTVVESPEPSTMALAGLGALGLIGYGVRRRKAQGV